MADPTLHPTDRTLEAFGLGKLDDDAVGAVHAHLEGCPDCRRRTSELSSDSFLDRVRQALDDRKNPDASKADSMPPGLADHPDYQIRRELGRGGMGVVYLAHNTLMGRDEVLKVMGREIVEKPGVLDRFLREIRAVARLRHPNIVTAYSAFRLGESIVFAMEYIEGLDLAKLVRAKGPLPVGHACSFVHQAALGLQHAHEEGMVHRDIKPGNLMLSRRGARGVVKVLDFGLAKATREEEIDGSLTRAGQMLGTPDYIAPEQTRDAQSADIRADIYSLGCSLYFLLTGGPPFRAKNLFEMLQAHQSVDAQPLNFVRPEVPAELAAIVGKMMAKEPGRRFQVPDEVAEALTPFFKKSEASSTRAKPDFSQLETTDAESKPGGHLESSRSESGPSTFPRTVVEPSSRPPQPSSMWESLIEDRGPEGTIAPTPAPGFGKKSTRIWAASIAGVLLAGLVAAWAGGVFRAEDRDGVVNAGGTGGLSRSADESSPQALVVKPPVPSEASGVPEDRAVKGGDSTDQVASRESSGDGFVPLFNGKDKSGWKEGVANKGEWYVTEDGILIGRGSKLAGNGRGYTYLLTDRGDYSDFRLRARFMEGSNGNIEVRYYESDNKFSSYHIVCGGELPAGSIIKFIGRGFDSRSSFNVVDRAEPVPLPQGGWNEMEIIARGNRVTTSINGRDVGSYVDDRSSCVTGCIKLGCQRGSTIKFESIGIQEYHTLDARVSVTPGGRAHLPSTEPSDHAPLAAATREKEAVEFPPEVVKELPVGSVNKPAAPIGGAFEGLRPATAALDLSAPKVRFPAAGFWPTLSADDSEGWRFGDPDRVRLGPKGLIVEAGPDGNCVFTSAEDFRKGTLRITLAASEGAEAYIALHATRRGNGGWRAVTSRVVEENGTVSTGGLGLDFGVEETGELSRGAKPGEMISIIVEDDGEGNRRLKVKGRQTAEIVGVPIPNHVAGGAVGLFLKSGTVVVQVLEVR